MKKIFLFSVALLCLLAIGNGYSLQGAWKLEVDSSYRDIAASSEVIFNFQKEIEEGKIVNRLTVFACAAVTFTYTIDNDNVNFGYERTLATRR